MKAQPVRHLHAGCHLMKRAPTERILVQQAAEAMRQNGRIPEYPPWTRYRTTNLREIIAAHTGPFYVC
jgi:hypothetical protein